MWTAPTSASCTPAPSWRQSTAQLPIFRALVPTQATTRRETGGAGDGGHGGMSSSTSTAWRAPAMSRATSSSGGKATCLLSSSTPTRAPSRRQSRLAAAHLRCRSECRSSTQAWPAVALSTLRRGGTTAPSRCSCCRYRPRAMAARQRGWQRPYSARRRRARKEGREPPLLRPCRRLGAPCAVSPCRRSTVPHGEPRLSP
mmetsp:Transcript_37542/g.121607  ORF Transcript_37542/g.121607 Transcript_37542/m.121607 type:complete len:200 (+) Transcript_37542:581-1180(+)